MKKLIILILICSFFIQLEAQEFGGHPSDVNWKHINTENVRVIFPEGQELRAFRIANIIDHIQENNTSSVGEKSKKISIVLHNNQVISNGFVSLAPYQSEFFGTAPQDFNFVGSMDWLDLLTIHEYRHSLQFVNGNRGLTKVGHVLLGQSGWASLLNLSVPNWYFEGDAIVSETLLSEAGRGRTPAFFAPQRANLLNGLDYSYMKSRNGSFKDIVPDHYALGFTMCNYTRNQYGTEVWRDILKNAGAYRYPWLYPFAFALEKNTGQFTKDIYQQSYDSLQHQWQEELKTLQLTATRAITSKDDKIVQNYKFVHLLNDGSWVALKTAYNETPAIVKINKNNERKITDVGYATEDFLSENNDKLAWTEYNVDIRRGNINYSNIVTFDLKKGKKQAITEKGKYFSPQFNSQGNKLITVEANEDYENNLVILNENGEVVQKIDNSNNYFLAYPKWTIDDKAIVYLAKLNNQVAIFKYNLAQATTLQLTNWTNHTITVPDVDENYVYFSASYSGIDNIYAVNLNGDKVIKQLTSVKVGAYQPEISGENLYMSEFTERGFMLTQLVVNPEDKAPFEYQQPVQMQRFNIQTTSTEDNIFDLEFNETYEVKNYNTLFRDIQLHSWSLGAISLNSLQFNLQFANAANDLRANTILDFNLNENGIGIFGELTIGKWFTEVSLKGANISRAAFYYPTPSTSDSLEVFTFEDRSFGVGASVPLSWVNGNYTTNLSIFSDLLLHNTSNYSNDNAPAINEIFPTWENTILFSRLHRKAVQHILPRYGQEFILSYNLGLNNNNINAINATGKLYFPGLSPNHGVELATGYARELQSNPYQFRDGFEYARGYYFTQNDHVFKLSANYHFPIAYPDWGFWNFIYFKRIRGNFFADYSVLSFQEEQFNQNALGFELIFDNIYLNLSPVSGGIRSSYLFNPDANLNNRNFNIELFTAVTF